MSKSNTLNDNQRKLVMDHLGMAYGLARKFAGLGRSRGVAEEDLRQEACLGLCIAAMKFEPDKGASFKTLAYTYCRKGIERALANGTSLPALPFRESAAGAYSSAAHSSNVASARFSASAARSSADTSASADTLDDEEETTRRQDCYLQVDRLLDRLAKREKKVVCLVYGMNGKPQGFREIGADMHIKQDRVKEMYLNAMKKMKMVTSLPALPFRERAFRTSGSRAA